MPLSKFVDSLYGELSLASSNGDAGIDNSALKSKSFETRARIRTARAAVAHFPAQVERVLTYPYTRNGFEVVGFGFHSTVLKMGDEVVKVLRRSVDKSPDWRLGMVEALRSRQDVAIECMGSYAIAQTFAIEPHPLARQKDVIIARQPFVIFDNTVLEHLDGVRAVSDSKQLTHFALAGLTMHHAHEMVPDILGSNNVVMKEGQLVLLDSTPMARSDSAAGYDKTVELLSRLVD